jgi:hypothetical protein
LAEKRSLELEEPGPEHEEPATGLVVEPEILPVDEMEME